MHVAHRHNATSAHPCCELSRGKQNNGDESTKIALVNWCSLCKDTSNAFQEESRASPVNYQETTTTTTSPPSPSCVSQASIEILSQKESMTKSASLVLPYHHESSLLEEQDSNEPLSPLEQTATTTTTTTTTAPITTTATRTTRLPSALKKPSSRKCNTKARRVRGLWNPYCHCLFSQLHDDVLLNILSYLNLNDSLIASQVCRRWRHCCLQESANWKQIEATEFVSQPRDPKVTSSTLQKRLSKNERAVESLTIKDIQHRLLPDIWLPSVSIMHNLQELKLSSFAALTDTHVHVMLMASTTFCTSSKPTKANSLLKKLSLEQCPLLTNKSVQYIAHNCSASLQELSFYGNTNITNITPLKNMWKQSQVSTPPPLQAFSNNSLQSLFFAPPPPPPQQQQQQQQVIFVPKTSSGGGGGKLCRFNIARTGVTGTGLCESLFQVGPTVALRELHASGDSWTLQDLQLFAKRVDLSVLQTFNIGCSNVFGSFKLSDISCFTADKNKNLDALLQVNLSGHAALSGQAIASLLSAAPNLTELNLNGCKGIVECVNSLAMALLTFGRRKGDGGGLQKLSLWRAFPSRKQVTDAATEAGQTLIQALCASPSAKVLQELDLEACYFFSNREMELLLKHCPRLTRDKIITRGTRCALEQA